MTVAYAGVVAVLVLGLLGCRSGDDEGAVRKTGTAGGDPAPQGDPFDQDDPGFEDSLRAFYQELLHASDLHRIPDDFAREHGSGLAELATPPVVARYDAWRAANEALPADDFRRGTEFTSLSNILDIKVDRAKATVRACTDE